MSWLLRNKLPWGIFLSAVYMYLLTDKNVLQLMMTYPWLNTAVSAITFGLMAAGWLRSDKEQKIIHLLKKSQEPTTEEQEVA